MTTDDFVSDDINDSIDDYLAQIKIVLVNTTLPANIGSAARAMHTMGLSHLTVVEPKLPIDDSSVSCAAGGLDVLNNVQISPSLTEALAPCQLIFAASSRSRHLPRPVVTPTQAADIMMDFMIKQKQVAQPNGSKLPNIAILFGREDRGLTNEELAFADFHIQIQANPAYPVLNVAAAVQVIASFIYAQIQRRVLLINNAKTDSKSDGVSKSATLDDIEHQLLVMQRQQWDEPAATHKQTQQLTEQITQLMVALTLADPEHLRALPQRLSRLTSRLQLDQKEYQLISAVLAKLKQRLIDSSSK